MSIDAIAERYSLGEAAVLTIQVGGDMILMPVGLRSVASALPDAVDSGAITEERINGEVGTRQHYLAAYRHSLPIQPRKKKERKYYVLSKLRKTDT